MSIAFAGACIAPTASFAVPRDPFVIFYPHEIQQHWTYVKTPLFCIYKQIPGHILVRDILSKAWKLKLSVPGIPNGEDIAALQSRAKWEINRLGLTHVMSVEFIRTPIIMSTGEPYYCAYVRGAKVDLKGYNLTKFPKRYDA